MAEVDLTEARRLYAEHRNVALRRPTDCGDFVEASLTYQTFQREAVRLVSAALAETAAEPAPVPDPWTYAYEAPIRRAELDRTVTALRPKFGHELYGLADWLIAISCEYPEDSDQRAGFAFMSNECARWAHVLVCARGAKEGSK